MKKLFTCILSMFVIGSILSLGCSKKMSPTGPAADTRNTITVAIQTINNNNAIYGQQYSASIIDGSGNTVSGATVTITSANGTQILSELMPGIYIYQNMGSPSYLEAQDYTVTIDTGSTVYTATAKSPGGITLAADGSNAVWTSEGNADTLVVSYPGFSSMQTFGPDISSPYDLNATNIYSHGAGSYSLTFMFMKTVTAPFSNASSKSTIIFQEEHATKVVK